MAEFFNCHTSIEMTTESKFHPSLPKNKDQKIKEREAKIERRKKIQLKHLKRVQFGIVLLFCTSVLLFQTLQCVDKYLAKSTGTADKYVHVSKTSFPVMTICPTYPYHLDRLQKHGLETKSDIQVYKTCIFTSYNIQ